MAALLATIVVTLACGQSFGHAPTGKEALDITAERDGNLWFAEIDFSRGGGYIIPRMGRLTLSGKVTEFALPASSHPEHIAVGGDGALWYTFADDASMTVGRFTSDGHVSEFTPPSGGLTRLAGPIAADPDGGIWVAGTSAIGKVTVADGFTGVYPLPAPPAGLPPAVNQPTSLALDPGGNLWFTYYDRGVIGHMTPTGAISEVVLSNPYEIPLDITLGPDNALWFIEQHLGRLGRVTAEGTLTERALEDDQQRTLFPLVLATAPDGTLWFGARHDEQGAPVYFVGHLGPGPDTTGEATVASVDYTVDGQIQSLAPGPDGDVWFTTTSTTGRQIGHVSSAGKVTYISLS